MAKTNYEETTSLAEEGSVATGALPSTQRLLQMVWSDFESSLEWPSKKSIFVRCQDAGIDFRETVLLHADLFWLRPRANDARVEEVALSYRALLQLPHGRQVLQGVPALLRLGAQRFIEHPYCNDDPGELRPRVGWDDIQAASGAKAQLLCRFLQNPTGFPFGLSADASGPWFEATAFMLKYGTVETPSDVLDVSFRGRIKVTDPPTGAHAELLQAAFDHFLSTGLWEVPALAAARHHQIGFLPELVDDLAPRYFVDAFGWFRSSRLRLRASTTLTVVEHSSELREELVRFAGELAKLYPEWPDVAPPIPLTLLAERLKVSSSDLARLALLAENEPWARGGSFGPSVPWGICVDEEILRYAGMSSWEDYRSVSDPLTGRGSPLQRPTWTGSMTSHAPDDSVTAEPTAVQVFISHVGEDRELAQSVVRCLEGALVVPSKGLRCTSVVGYGLDPGDQASIVLRQNLRECSMVLALVTTSSLRSGWVLMELGAAWALEKRTCPILAGGINFDELPGPLRDTHSIRAGDAADLAELVDVVARATGWDSRNSGQRHAAVEEFARSAKLLGPTAGEPQQSSLVRNAQATSEKDALARLRGWIRNNGELLLEAVQFSTLDQALGLSAGTSRMYFSKAADLEGWEGKEVGEEFGLYEQRPGQLREGFLGDD